MKYLLLLYFFFWDVQDMYAQQTAQKYVQETQYLLYLPDNYLHDTLKKWPVIIFLHGSGESGNNLDKLKVYGPPQLIEKGKKFPFIIVSPQAVDAQTGHQAQSLKGLLEDLKKQYRVDEDRVYLTGLSMGGYATWELAEKNPEAFAAIAPLCSGGDVSKVWKLRHMPVWSFHGAKDDAVPLAASQQMIDSLKIYNSNARLTVYPEANHNCWDLTYNDDSLYNWFLAQKRFVHKRIPVQESMLKKYAGTYTANENDTVQIIFRNTRLYAGNGSNNVEDQVELIPADGHRFFISENLLTEIIFPRNNEYSSSSFWLYDRHNKTQYHNIKLR